MSDIIEDLWYKKTLYTSFKNEMNLKGYCLRDLFVLQVNIDNINNFITKESLNILNDILIRDTYYRLLKQIVKGEHNLIDIMKVPDNWVLNPIEKDIEAWISNDVLIFLTKDKCAVFSKKSRKSEGFQYQKNRWQ